MFFGEMEEVLQDIERAMQAEAWDCALSVALAMPDLCGALESSDGRATKQNYVR